VLAFLVFFLAITGGISFASGWRQLAGRFASDRPVHGEDFRFAWVAFARGAIPVAYKGCVFANVGSSGIALSMLFLFRFLHPRLFIPWPEIESCVRQKYWLMNVVAVQVRGFNGKLMFRGGLGNRIFDMWAKTRLPSPRPSPKGEGGL
jgi:hypothetical protein